ncbi:MAG TPA: hypothetical protein VGA42_10550 [Gemmatimonadales bacterium]
MVAVAAIGAAAVLPPCLPADLFAQAAPRTETFAGLIDRLSEPGGYFDSDNLISNEGSYLHVLDGLRSMDVRGGAYIGVGPDQNFSYIARIRPDVAYLIDIRRDNLLLHLLFKALFAESRTRVEYLSLLFGRAPPREPGRWIGASVLQLAEWVDSTPATETSIAAAIRRAHHRIRRFGVPLSGEDLQTIDRFHRAFITDGLELRFASAGRAPRAFYPTYRELMTARDRSGQLGHFLVAETHYWFLRDLHTRDRVIPVVGDLAGPRALAAIGRDIAGRNLVISALYVSNVEFYLFGSGTFDRYAATVRGLPRDRRSVMVRSWFGRFSRQHPHAVPGFGSTQVLQTMDAFLRGLDAGYASYWDVTTFEPVPP